jgi:flagellar protein FliS
MDTKTAADAYRQSTIENAPPIKIVRLLYEGAIRYLDRAVTVHEGPSREFTNWLHRADAIVIELRLALDHTHDAEVTRRLEELYVFVEDEIAKAMQTRAVEHVRSARSILATLLEAWVAVEVGGPGDGNAGGVG